MLVGQQEGHPVLPFWYRPTPGSPGKRAVKWVCVCVCACSIDGPEALCFWVVHLSVHVCLHICMDACSGRGILQPFVVYFQFAKYWQVANEF